MTDQEHARAIAEQAVRVFPIQDTGGGVLWADAEKAYQTYSQLFGTDQSLERLAERGGFGFQEFACLYAGHEPYVGWNPEFHHRHHCAPAAWKCLVVAARAQGAAALSLTAAEAERDRFRAALVDLADDYDEPRMQATVDRVLRGLAAVVVALLIPGLVSAQTIRTINVQPVFVTYLQTTAGVTARTPQWTTPTTKGPALVAQDNSFWHGAGASYGAITLVNAPNNPYLWVNSTQVMTTGCNFGQLLPDVKAAMGSVVPVNTLRLIVLPPGTPCNSQTVGTVSPTQGAFAYVVAGAFEEHETGHGLGLGHAWAQHCNVTCTNQEYGNADMMGAGGVAIKVASRIQLGVYSSTFQLATITTSQDITLRISDDLTPGIKGALITPPSTAANGFQGVQHNTTLELRKGDFASFGVQIHGAPNGYLLDLDRTTPTDRWTLKLQETYCDLNWLCVTLLAQDTVSATLHVTVLTGVPAALPSPVNHVR